MDIFFLQLCGVRHLTTTQSGVCILSIHTFCDTNIYFHREYIDTNWGMCIVSFTDVGILLMADIIVHSIMEKLQNSYSEHRDEIV